MSAVAPSPLTTLQSLPFPVLDAFLGVSAATFFESDWQRNVHVFPEENGPARLSTAGFDFRATIATALKAGKLELLGGKDRPGPQPGDADWPLVPNAVSARVTRSDDHSETLGRLCRQLTEETSHRVHVNLYVTPPQSRGLDRHQDGHDVLVLQVEGRKRWRIWRNDAPVPLDSFPALTFEGSKRIRRDYRGTAFGGRGVADPEISGKEEWNFDLKPGDLIYVPRGWAHEVWTEDSYSAHLTFGLHLVSWVDLLIAVASQASRRHSDLRESLPIGFARVAPAAESVREKARSLVALLSDADGAEAMEEVIGRWMHRDMEVAPPDPVLEGQVKGPFARLRRRGPAAFVSRSDSVGLFRPSARASEVWMPKAFAKALQFVATVEPAEFEVRDLPGVSPSGKTRLCELLVAQGYLEAVPEKNVEIVE